MTTSRILWSVGFHQPPTYYVSEWQLSGEEAGVQPGGRFRPTLSGHEVVGDWSWYDNPFLGSQEFRGLVVANLILNNWDWKTSNNKIYAISEPGRAPGRQFVVRDLGASLGKTSYPSWLKWLGLRGFGQGSRNDVDGFEQQGFVLGVNEDSTVAFDYHGIHNDLVESLTAADVRWTCELLSRLSDQQWNDAFRAGGFSPDRTNRYVRKIKAKLAQGLALPLTSDRARTCVRYEHEAAAGTARARGVPTGTRVHGHEPVLRRARRCRVDGDHPPRARLGRDAV